MACANLSASIITMAPKKITVEGVGGVKLSINSEYKDWLNRRGLLCLKDSDECEIADFQSRLDGGKDTLGPRPHRQQDGGNVNEQVINGRPPFPTNQNIDRLLERLFVIASSSTQSHLSDVEW
mmetsp:Transcript_153/g.251  ORF Transcript_153/g.251 Transcript_153/m.251 type:complete len:123 (+) Transcript_153:3-371(+)